MTKHERLLALKAKVRQLELEVDIEHAHGTWLWCGASAEAIAKMRHDVDVKKEQARLFAQLFEHVTEKSVTWDLYLDRMGYREAAKKLGLA